jgi:endoglucanase
MTGMKHTIPLCVLATLTLAVMPQLPADGQAGKGDSPIFAACKKLGRGINMGNALEAPKEGEWGVTLKAEYFKAIKDAGFDSVRIPIRWSAHAKAEAPYTIDPKSFERIDWVLEQTQKNKLNVMLNAHHYDEFDDNPDKHLPRMVGIWEQIAARYKDRPDSVYFEPLNEPHNKLNDKWNAVMPSLIGAIRKTNPTRPIVVGPVNYNNISMLTKLVLPDDPNLILTVHCYDPFQFTHQNAPWQKGSEKWAGKKWTGTDEEKAALTKTLTKALDWAKAHNRPLFLGEFGAYQAADMDSRARWTRFMAREAERLGMSWAYWEFCSGFGAYDPNTDKWREPLKDALVK